jgi:hypothetical protein
VTALGGGAAIGVIALLATAGLWGSNHVVARGAADLVPLAVFVFWRWALALPVLLALAWPGLRRDWPVIRASASDLVLIGTIGVGVFSVFLIAGADYSLAIEVSIINTTTPAWVAVIGWASGRERLGRAGLAGLAIAFAGALLIVTRRSPGHHRALGRARGRHRQSLRARRRRSLRVVHGAAQALSGPARDPLADLRDGGCRPRHRAPAHPCRLARHGGEPLVMTGGDMATGLLVLVYAALAPTLLANVLYIFGVARSARSGRRPFSTSPRSPRRPWRWRSSARAAPGTMPSASCAC